MSMGNQGKDDTHFINWVFLNIFLPMAPILIRLAIVIFSNSTPQVLVSSELLFFNMIICVLVLNLLHDKNSRIEYMLEKFLGVIIVLDVVLLVLIYSNNEHGGGIHSTTIVLAVLVIILAFFYKRKLVVDMKGAQND